MKGKFYVGEMLTSGETKAEVINRTDDTITLKNSDGSVRTTDILLRDIYDNEYETVLGQKECAVAWAEQVLLDGEYEENISYFYA